MRRRSPPSTGLTRWTWPSTLGLAIAGDRAGVQIGIPTVRDALDGQILKVILETAVLTREPVVTASLAAEQAGADFVKTSTGFHPAGGASVAAVETMAATIGGRVGIKAAGGSDARTALALIDANVTRLGVSSTAIVLDEIAISWRARCARPSGP